ncbi:hypothetical protein KBY99_13100 [Cyanobium sp. Maggiore-St4-Cus]|nr:hypothetical protein [Cyanobium sp. Maggiore-St4-Cus]
MAVLANDTAVKPQRRQRRARGAERSAATRVSPCAARKPGQAGWRDRQTSGAPPRSLPGGSALQKGLAGGGCTYRQRPPGAPGLAQAAPRRIRYGLALLL